MQGLAAASASPDYQNVLVMSAAAFAVRLFLGFVPRIRVPGPVLEIVVGVIIGPQVLGWVVVDEPVVVLSTLGLAFLLFLAGMEIDLRSLRGRDGRIAVAGFGISVVIALAIGIALEASGLIINGVLVGFALTASSLGLLIPLLADEGELRSPLGRFVIAARPPRAPRPRPHLRCRPEPRGDVGGAGGGPLRQASRRASTSLNQSTERRIAAGYPSSSMRGPMSSRSKQPV